MKNSVKKIIVVGGGFAGLNLLKGLNNKPGYHITLVDVNNYHSFPPLLYQVAMALIEPMNIIYPFRRFLQKRKNIRFHLGKLLRVNPESNSIETERSRLDYDYLVLAVGTRPKFFGMKNVSAHAWPLKTIDDATNLRNHILLNIEKAIQCNDEAERKRLLTVVIAGGGPTGVEVAGMMAEMVREIGPKEYPEIAKGTFAMYLVQSSPVLLKTMSAKAQTEALHVLTELGIRVVLNTKVVDYVNGSVVLSNGAPIPTNALIWTSGVVGMEIEGLPKDILGHGARVNVDDHLRVMGTANVFAIGDIALGAFEQKYPHGHPQLAQVAIQQGQYLARSFSRSADIARWGPFSYKEKGTMAIISKYKAVADLPNFSLSGFFAWLMWLFIHLLPIAGFRNKINLAMSWAWAFITDNPTLRLIIRPQKKQWPEKQDTPEQSRTTAGLPAVKVDV